MITGFAGYENAPAIWDDLRRPRQWITGRQARVNKNMVSAGLLGLEGVEIEAVERGEDGRWTVRVHSAAGRQACCARCGQVAERIKEPMVHPLRHLVLVPVCVMWHKSRFWCDNDGCQTVTFAESGPVASPGAEVSAHAKKLMGHLVGDWMVPPSRVAAAVGVSWHTAHEGFVAVAAAARIVVTDTKTDTKTDVGTDTKTDVGTDTKTDVGAGAVSDAADAADAADVADVADVAETSEVERPRRSVSGVLPRVEALGIDDHRRGRPLYHWDPRAHRWAADADRWQTVFVDSAGGHGLLGQVEGRAGLDAVAWLTGQDPEWRAAVRYVTIDMSTVYKSVVVKHGVLPNARVIVDLFHVVQLAGKMIGDVRRRVIFERYGRRGRATDPEYAIKSVLLRGRERLSERARHRLLCALADLGEGGRQIGAAWRAKELLRDLVKLSPNQTGLAPNRAQIAAALEAFFVFCGTVGGSVPEIHTLAETISTWRAEICLGVATGHSNAAAEGVNRLVKLVYRSGFGFTNVTNQQRRSRYTASRGTRPTWLAAAPRRQAPTATRDGRPATATLPADQPPSRHLNLLGEGEDPQLHTVTTEWAQQVAA